MSQSGEGGSVCRASVQDFPPTMSDTHQPHDGSGGSARRRSLKRSTPPFHCTHSLKEDHEDPLYACSFNPYCDDDDEAIFATVGSCRATVYRCTEEEFKPIFCFVDPEDDIFYACTWLYDYEGQSYVLAIGGKRGVIHLIPFCGRAGINHLVGHGQAINELRAHPTEPCILLSGSKDHEMRLWNIRNGVCIAIFGGDLGHKSEILTCDFDLLGERIVSSGMDHCIKIWSLLDNHRVDKAMQQSKTYTPQLNETSFPTVKVTQPDFSTLDLHKNYVDCVRWFGETLISKSCESTVCHWKPGSQRHLDFCKGETNVSLLHRWKLPYCDLWFIKFTLDPQFKRLAAGNQIGKIYIWNLNELSAPSRCLQHNKCTTAVRAVDFSPNGSTLIAVCEDSTVWMWTMRKEHAT